MAQKCAGCNKTWPSAKIDDEQLCPKCREDEDDESETERKARKMHGLGFSGGPR